jgi:GNAT superfamily N-acetyltransferase
VHIRPFQRGDESAIVGLFRDSFGRPIDTETWAWRYQKTPEGPGIVRLAWDGDVLAAHYAVSTVSFCIDGKEWLTGLSGTTMTHPRYRGLGLFPAMAEEVYAEMGRGGRAMVWGFPNKMSHHSFVQKLGWTDIYEIPTFRLCLENAVSLPAPGREVVFLGQFDDRFDALWDKAKGDYRVIGRRDRRFLAWRYAYCPFERYRIMGYVKEEQLLGYAVIKRYRDEVHIVDLFTRLRDLTAAEQLVRHAVEFSRGHGARSLSLWLNVSHPLHRSLEKYGFRNEAPVAYWGGRGLSPAVADQTLYDFRNWHLAMGDSDVY